MKISEYQLSSIPGGWSYKTITPEMRTGMRMFSTRMAELAKDEPTLFVCENGETFTFQKYKPNEKI